MRVGEPTGVEHLQQERGDLRVRLLDLVEQQDGVRVAPHGLGELPGVVVADVPGGAPIMRVTAERSVYSESSSRTSLSGEPKSASASARASSVLPTPVGPRNRNDPTGRPG